jgi:small subunit ribosomal protein S14|tara:strand:+ start:426 stop:728 length:303 start_codon:yes stop_codon:yes gene_type:complete
MAKQSMIQREIKRENLISKYEGKREFLKQQLNNEDGYKVKLQIYKKFEKIPRNSAAVRHRNRCWVTGRSRGFYRDFGLSRHVVREMAHEGIIPGLKKSSW